MAILPIIADSTDQLTTIFKDLPAHPETGFEQTRTCGIVAEKLKAYGADAVHSGIDGTGVVGICKGAAVAGASIMARIVEYRLVA